MFSSSHTSIVFQWKVHVETMQKLGKKNFNRSYSILKIFGFIPPEYSDMGPYSIRMSSFGSYFIKLQF